MAVSNHQFAEAVGCNYTMASRLRNGKRSPSVAMLAQICLVFGLDQGEALRKCSEGAEVFARWLRENVFEAEEEEEDIEPVMV